jgi:CheY-like chemotaxis protein
MTTALRILVVEDDEGDQMLLRRAFAKAGVKAELRFVADGEETIAYLQGRPPYENPIAFPLPNLLLLDLKMSRVNGFDVLEWLRGKPALGGVLVVVFSSSSDPTDRQRAKALGAKAYIIKPPESEELVQVVKGLEQYWEGIRGSGVEVLPEGPPVASKAA